MASVRSPFPIDAFPMRHICLEKTCYDVQEIEGCFVIWNADFNKAKLFRPLRGTNKIACWCHETRNVRKKCPGGLLPRVPSDQDLAIAAARHRDCGLRDTYTGQTQVGQYKFRDVAKAVMTMKKEKKI